MRSITRIGLCSAFTFLWSVQMALAVPYTGGTGPGGFILTGPASDLTMWLRGDQGITKDGLDQVSQWNDQSGRNNHVKQVTTLNQPLQNGTLNSVPVVRFDGGSQGANADFLITDGGLSAQTILIVNRATGTPSQPNPILGNTTNYLSIRRSASSWDFPGNSDDFTFPTGTFRVNGATSTISTVNVAQQFAAERSSAFGFTRVQLARHNSGVPTLPERSFQGDIGEVVMINRALNNVERIIVENSLSAKYDLPLSTGGGALDLYAGDDPLQGNYDSDVVGIGNNATNSVTNAGQSGFGIQVTEGSLGANEWVLAGHETPVNSIVTLDNASPDLVGSRWDRVWYVDKTETDGINATFGFDFEDAGLSAPLPGSSFQLLYSVDSNFTDGWQILGETFTQSNGTVTFNLLNASLLDGYYTLGLNIAYVPEPNSLLLMLGVLGCGMLRRRRRIVADQQA